MPSRHPALLQLHPDVTAETAPSGPAVARTGTSVPPPSQAAAEPPQECPGCADARDWVDGIRDPQTGRRARGAWCRCDECGRVVSLDAEGERRARVADDGQLFGRRLRLLRRRLEELARWEEATAPRRQCSIATGHVGVSGEAPQEDVDPEQTRRALAIRARLEARGTAATWYLFQFGDVVRFAEVFGRADPPGRPPRRPSLPERVAVGIAMTAPEGLGRALRWYPQHPGRMAASVTVAAWQERALAGREVAREAGMTLLREAVAGWFDGEESDGIG